MKRFLAVLIGWALIPACGPTGSDVHLKPAADAYADPVDQKGP